jgi:DNA-binding beta-propeller fold protein YncE
MAKSSSFGTNRGATQKPSLPRATLTSPTLSARASAPLHGFAICEAVFLSHLFVSGQQAGNTPPASNLPEGETERMNVSRLGRYALSTGGALAMLAGCGGAQETTPAAPPVSNRPVSSLSSSNELLYVANFSGSVTTYDLQTYDSDPYPIRTISQPQPSQIVFNAQGYLFVVTQWWYSKSTFLRTNFREPKTGFIGVYAPGSTKLERTITDGLDGPRALAIDSSGNLYVANSGYKANDVTVYSAPKYKLVATIDSNTVGTTTLALDSAQNLYVAQGSAYGNSSIMVYAHKTLKLIRTITNGIACPNTLAFDREGRLYVANNIGSCGNSVTIYAHNSTGLLQTISDGIDTPEGLAFDSAQNLYVGNNWGDSVTVYAPKARGLKYTITHGMDMPDALAFDSQGSLAVTLETYNRGGVAIIPPGAKKPTSVIQKGVDNPASVAFSSR